MSSMRSGLAAGAAVLMTAGLLAGCGSSGTPTVTTLAPSVVVPALPSPSPAAANEGSSVAPTTAPATTATPIATAASELSSLASQYSAIAAKGDLAVVQCNKERVAAEGGTLAKAKAVAADCLASTSGYVAQLQAVSWGPVQPQANRVIAAIARIEVLFDRMAHAPDVAVFRVAYSETAAAVGELLVVGTALREALGLPPVQF